MSVPQEQGFLPILFTTGPARSRSSRNICGNNECPAHGICPIQVISLPFSRLKEESNQLKKIFPSTYCVPGTMPGNGDTDTEKILPIELTARSGRQVVKRYPWNRMSDAERGVWWVGLGYLPITTVPSISKNPFLIECSQQPFLLPIVRMMPEAASTTQQLSLLLLC